ncbi:MAG: 50S ribosomal protein L11 methyltransferase [Christensenellales bacterium]|jgi:ribosomal protein L11 methyltransferase
MDWIQVSVTTVSGAADALSALLMDAGAKGTQILDRHDVPAADDGSGFGELYGTDLLDNLPEQVTIKAWFASDEEVQSARQAVARLGQMTGFDTGELVFSTASVQDEDWAENWKRYYKPLRAGQRLVIRPVWENYEQQPDDLVIAMDPGMAFGTGTHETTRLCMRMIEKHYQQGPALDIGTGSGILAIALAKLGCPSVRAVDIDPIAVAAARQNIVSNGLEHAITVAQGDLAHGLAGPFDFICANILADVIIGLSASIRPLLSDSGRFLASGIIKDREGDVLAAFSQAGFLMMDRLTEGEWVALLFGSAHA